jgi:ABC-2 type transport system permease protein
VQFVGRRVRPYLSTAMMGATEGVGEHPLMLLDRSIALLRVAIVVLVWQAILRSPHAPHDPPASGVLTYIVLAQVLALQLNARSEVLTAVWDGTVATRLLRPMSAFGDYIAEMAGRWGLHWVTFSLPALALALLLHVRVVPASATRAAAFLVSLVLSIAVGTAVDFLFALLVVRSSENMWSFRMARDALVPVLSGAVIPLSLLPWSIGSTLAWLPFASMVAAPLRIYTGDGDVARLLGLQAAWAVVLWLVTRRCWTRNASRMVSFGG